MSWVLHAETATGIQIHPPIYPSFKVSSLEFDNYSAGRTPYFSLRSIMAFLLRHIARYAVRKIASDPVARDQATRAARGVAKEVKQIARDEEPAKAAGRAMRRAINRLQGG